MMSIIADLMRRRVVQHTREQYLRGSGSGGSKDEKPTSSGDELSRMEKQESKLNGDTNTQTKTEPRTPRSSSGVVQSQIKTDMRVLEEDVEEGASVKDIQDDFIVLLNDCERYLASLSHGDHEEIRQHLGKIFIERDGWEDEEGTRRVLLQDDDTEVRVS